ncbi:hypothetical protein [Solidesulfovibrio carbinolicus]|uniref:hypothetical protein n=1 Tax=Solidesulfovibrio carbinolicus TaxID=296842 RepID=UPI0010121F39|nr:hypothetical protein [Solidesulfovibrio carbinolicus]
MHEYRICLPRYGDVQPKKSKLLTVDDGYGYRGKGRVKTYLQGAIEILENFFDTNLGASGLRDFLERHDCIEDWILASDYSLTDKNKPNKIMCISIMPYTKSFSSIKDEVDTHAPKDIKNVKYLNKEFVSYLGSDSVFHICFVITGVAALGETKEDVGEIARNFLKLYEGLIKKSPSKKDHYSKAMTGIKKLIDDTQRKHCSFEIFQNMHFLSIIVAFLYYYINKSTCASKIAWFSDRDPMTTKYKNLPFEFLVTYYDLISGLKKNNKERVEIFIGSPEASGPMWYDAITRIPDYIAGSFADWKIDKNECKNKFSQIIEKVGANKKTLILLRIGFHKENIEFIHHNIRNVPHFNDNVATDDS